MKKTILYALLIFASVLIFHSLSLAVQMGGPGPSYPEIVRGTMSTDAGVRFPDGLQTTTAATSSVQVIFDGGGAAIETGQVDVVVPFRCTIQKVYLLADQTGSIEVSVSKATAWPPDFTAFTGNPAITNSTYNDNISIGGAGWGNTIEQGNILRFNVVSCTSIQRCLVTLVVKRI